jgi:hypothetical protein
MIPITSINWPNILVAIVNNLFTLKYIDTIIIQSVRVSALSA